MKITLEEWKQIGRGEPSAKYFVKYELYQNEDLSFQRVCKVKIIPYLILFIPISIINIFICCFDGGLKEYEFPKRIVREDHISNCYLTAWEKANKIYGKRGEI